MIYPDVERIIREGKAPNIYVLTVAAFKRAKQLFESKEVFLDRSGKKGYIRRALDEIAAGQLELIFLDESSLKIASGDVGE